MWSGLGGGGVNVGVGVGVGGGTSSVSFGDDYHDGPTTVYVNTMIRSISKIDDYKMVREKERKKKIGSLFLSPPPQESLRVWLLLCYVHTVLP